MFVTQYFIIYRNQSLKYAYICVGEIFSWKKVNSMYKIKRLVLNTTMRYMYY